jgi:hypothetical protein
MESDLKDNPFSGLAEMAVQSVQIQWGWLLLLGGAGCMIFAGWRQIQRSQRSALSETLAEDRQPM